MILYNSITAQALLSLFDLSTRKTKTATINVAGQKSIGAAAKPTNASTTAPLRSAKMKTANPTIRYAIPRQRRMTVAIRSTSFLTPYSMSIPHFSV